MQPSSRARYFCTSHHHHNTQPSLITPTLPADWANIQVRVSNVSAVPGTRDPLATGSVECKTRLGKIRKYTVEFKCNTAVLGRFVTIQVVNGSTAATEADRPEKLALCDVQVFQFTGNVVSGKPPPPDANAILNTQPPSPVVAGSRKLKLAADEERDA